MEIEQSESKGLSNEHETGFNLNDNFALFVTVFTSVDRASNSASGCLNRYSVIALLVDQNGS